MDIEYRDRFKTDEEGVRWVMLEEANRYVLARVENLLDEIATLKEYNVALEEENMRLCDEICELEEEK